MPSSGFKTCADRKSTRLNSSHTIISYAVFCLKKKNRSKPQERCPPDPRAAGLGPPPARGPRDDAAAGAGASAHRATSRASVARAVFLSDQPPPGRGCDVHRGKRLI